MRTKLVDLLYRFMQHILVYIVLLSAVLYLCYRGYLAFVKKKTAKGCASCPARQGV